MSGLIPRQSITAIGWSRVKLSTNTIVSKEDNFNNRGITILTLNNGKVNAFSREMVSALQDMLSEIRRDLSARVLIIRSANERVFCAGADLKERMQMTEVEVASFVSKLRATITQVSTLSIPSIAVIEGSALGGGLELALAADYRVCASHSQIKLGLPECTLGIIPGAGGTQRLPKLVGASNAKRLIYGGEIISPVEALSMGLIDQLHENPYEAAMMLAEKWAHYSSPIALRMAKLAINGGIDLPLASGLALEEMCYAQVVPTEDRKEALLAFAEKRKPIFKGK